MAQGQPKRPYTLLDDGGGREKLWAREIFGDDKGYEQLWSEHVAPLTFRVVDRNNHYLRPSVNEPLRNLADTLYATLFHITEAHAWTHRLKSTLAEFKSAAGGRETSVTKAGRATEVAEEKRIKEAFLPTEALYCFFSHGYSLLESSVKFGRAVNTILGEYAPSRKEPFTVIDVGDDGRSKRLGSWGDARSEKAYRDLSTGLSGYRASLVHDKPVFILTRRIPRQGQEKEWSGLAAICRAVRDRERYLRQTVGVSTAFDELLVLMRAGMCGIWGTAATALGPLLSDSRYLRAQREGIEKDRELTLDKIKNFIALTRLG